MNSSTLGSSEDPSSNVFDSSSDWKERDGWSSSAAAWLARGSATGAILCMPLGPVGFISGGIVGGGLTVSFGLLADWIRFTSKQRYAASKEARLEHILRWAEFVFGRSDEPQQLFLYMVAELESTVLMARESRAAANINKRFKEFLVRWDVQSVASDCLLEFFSEWRTATSEEIAACRRMCSTCSLAFYGERRIPSVYERMGDLLNIPEVQRLFASLDRLGHPQAQPIRDDWAIIADLKEKKVEQLFRKDVVQRLGFGKRRQGGSESMQARLEHRASAPAVRSVSGGALISPHPLEEDGALTAPVINEPPPDAQTGASPLLQQSSLTIRAASGDLEVPRHAHKAGTVTRGPQGAGLPPPTTRRQLTSALTVPTKCPNPFFAESPAAVPDESGGRPPSVRSNDHIPIEIADSGRLHMSSAYSRGLSTGRRSADSHIECISISPPGPVRGMESPEAAPGGALDEESVSIPILVGATEGEERRQATARDNLSESFAYSRADSVARLRSQGSLRELRDEIRKSIHSQEGLVPGQADGEGPEIVSKKSVALEPTEQRFFKNLQDLTDFSPELKHKIPIGVYEFEFLNNLEPQSANDGWDKVSDKNKTRIYKRIVTVAGSDLVMVKGYAQMDGIPVDWVLWNIRDTPRRTAWDKTFDGFLLVEGDIQSNEMVYNSIRAPWPATDRDFLQWRRTSLDTDGTVKIYHRSAEHPAFPEGDGSKMIRAESIISAYIIRPRGTDSCDLFLVTQADIKGLVPRWLVNATAAKAPNAWIENLRKACREAMGWGKPIPQYNPRPMYCNGVKLG